MISRFAALLLWCSLLASAFGQGLIDLNNRGMAQVFDATGKPLTGTRFVAQIWYGSSANSLTKSFAPAPFRSSTTPLPGTWNPSAVGGPGTFGVFDGFGPGSTVTLQVVVWDSLVAGLGPAQALAGLPGTGRSGPFTYTIPADPLAIPGGLGNMRPFTLVSASRALINLDNRGLAPVLDAKGKPLTGTSFVAQVWYGPSASSLTKAFVPAPFRDSNTPFPGTWDTLAAGGPGMVGTLEGYGPGSTVTLQVVVWDSSVAGLGPAQALAGLPGTGRSESFTYTIPADPLAIPAGMENLRPFSLVSATKTLINLNNRGLAQVFDAAGNPLTGTGFVAQIWYGPSTDSLTNSFAPAPFRVSITTLPGTWNPSAAGGPGNVGTMDGFGLGSTVTLRVAVWDSSLAGIGVDQALARLPGTGLSEPFTYTIPRDPAAVPGGLENMRSFSLVSPTPGQAPILSIVTANPDGSITLQIRADRGATVDLERSGDLKTWALVRSVHGQGMESPVSSGVPTDPGTQAVFWRLRQR
jgi:hypothetical protein